MANKIIRKATTNKTAHKRISPKKAAPKRLGQIRTLKGLPRRIAPIKFNEF